MLPSPPGPAWWGESPACLCLAEGRSPWNLRGMGQSRERSPWGVVAGGWLFQVVWVLPLSGSPPPPPWLTAFLGKLREIQSICFWVLYTILGKMLPLCKSHLTSMVLLSFFHSEKCPWRKASSTVPEKGGAGPQGTVIWGQWRAWEDCFQGVSNGRLRRRRQTGHLGTLPSCTPMCVPSCCWQDLSGGRRGGNSLRNCPGAGRDSWHSEKMGFPGRAPGFAFGHNFR